MESKSIDKAVLLKGFLPSTVEFSFSAGFPVRTSSCVRRTQIHARYSSPNDTGLNNGHGKGTGHDRPWNFESGGRKTDNVLVAGIGFPILSFRKLFHRDDSSHSSVASNEPTKKVLILMSDTGGGHRASAMALKDAFEEVGNGKYEVSVVDIWTEHTPFPFNQLPKSYGFLVRNSWMWQTTYNLSQNKAIEDFCFGTSGLYVSREIRKFLKSENPDLIISVHPLMQHIPLQALKSMDLLDKIPFITVVTDFVSCHPTWFHKLTNLTFVATEPVRNAGLQRGLSADKIVVHGLPVRRDFRRKQVKKETVRRKLGLDPKLPCVLLMGGGEGMGPVEATAKTLNDRLSGLGPGDAATGQIVIVCGRNKALQSRLESMKWKIPAKILGFTSQIFDFMNASNCVVTKAGPGTIAESLICALPLILVDYIPGQEEANVPYVVENGVGVFIREPDAVAQQIGEWFGERVAELKEMSKRALKLGRPNATIDIISSIIELHRAKELVAV